MTTESKLDIASNKAEFISRISCAEREGVDFLLNYLDASGFFEAPASTKYHMSCEGGLCKHSLSVCDRLLNNLEAKLRYPTETLVICALLHDVCKANYYAVDYRNVKQPSGTWAKEPYYTVKDGFPYGHGEKSVYIVGKHVCLTDDEAMAIRWHMGAFDEAHKGGSMRSDRCLRIIRLRCIYILQTCRQRT
ncbi:MAG: hypothetical protein WC966_10705 [Bradymonadales bacterium]